MDGDVATLALDHAVVEEEEEDPRGVVQGMAILWEES